MRSFIACSTMVAVLCGLTGCGGRGIPIVPIKGQVTFGGSPPPSAGKIVFSPVEDPSSALPARPGNADFGDDGSFNVSTFSAGDGLIPGRYWATVLCFRETPTLENQQSVSYVPPDFRPEVTVPNDVGSFDLTIDVPATRVPQTAR